MAENLFSETFSSDIESILENIRVNCVILSKEHKKNYFSLKNSLKHYRLPIIIISGLNSVISIGTQPFIPQQYISLGTCLLGLICGLIGSVELFFGISQQMEIEMDAGTQFYILSTDIFKMLSLNRCNRGVQGKVFLDECYCRYIKLVESSGTIRKKVTDHLACIQISSRVTSSSLESYISTPSIEN